jgi:tetraacyldisaccharide 4'-kinase
MKALSPLGWLYGLAAGLRNSLYNAGIFRSSSLGARTISIGNLTTGGTGKTPLVAQVAAILVDAGERVCILSRGYGREQPSELVLVSDGESVLADARTGGDEPVELALKLLGKVLVVAGRDRVDAAAWAREQFDITTFILDDGFQHRRAARDLDIVCIDATDPFGGGELLPAGRLRESIANFARADVVVITRSDLVADLRSIEDTIHRYAPNVEVFCATNRLARLMPITEYNDQVFKGPAVVESHVTIKRRRAFAFCGLGSPETFFRLLERDGFNIAGKRVFADHHYFSVSDIASLGTEARAAHCECLITTAKDAVRLGGAEFDLSCYVAEIETEVSDEERFRCVISPS